MTWTGQQLPEYIPFFDTFCSTLAKYLLFSVNIWSQNLNIWVHPCQIYNIWHLLTKRFPKIYTLWGQNGKFPYLCLTRSKYLLFSVNIWSHNLNIWVHPCQIYNIWHLLTKRFPKIYTLWGQNGKFPYLCLTRAVLFPTSISQNWAKITWPKLERAQTKLAINYYWDQKFSLSLGELWPTKKNSETGCFKPGIHFL